MVMASPYRDSQTRWRNGKIFSLDPSSEEILLPFEGRREREKGGKMKFPTARKLRRAGNGKKVSNCSRTPANSIKICSARRSGRYIGKVAGFVHGFFFGSARKREEKLFSEHGNYESWAAVGSRRRGRAANCNRPPHQIATAPATVKMVLLLPLHARRHNCSRTLENVTASRSR